MRPFIARYPKFLADSLEFCDLQQALESELLELWDARDSALAQLCAETATWGLQYWEKTLGIPVDEGKDLDVRRSRVRVKLLGVDVTTVEVVRKSAEIYSGQKAVVTEFPEQFRFEISFPDFPGIPPNTRELAASLREIIPAHLQCEYLFAFVVSNAIKSGLTAFSETLPQVEIWPRALRYVESIKAAAATGYYNQVEVYPAEEEDT